MGADGGLDRTWPSAEKLHQYWGIGSGADVAGNHLGEMHAASGPPLLVVKRRLTCLDML